MNKRMHDYLNEHQRKAVEALEFLQEVCSKHGIHFYLLAGTTLGAVRHKGMIPWDDDVDIGLKYEDWHKLRRILPNEIKSTEFQYMDDVINSEFPRLFGKILCHEQNCVDIFLISKWPDNVLKQKVHWQIRKTAVEFYKFSLQYKAKFRPTTTLKDKIRYYLFNGLRYVIYIFSRVFFNRDDYVNLARWNESVFERKNTAWYINLYSIYRMEKEMIRAEWIDKPSFVEFEGKKYETVGDTDAYLRHLYGDYMTPPPLKHRVGTHSEKFNQD